MPAWVISLLATLMVLVLFLLMVEETIAIAGGRDPLSNGVRALSRRAPSVVFALAVVIGMVLGHLLWP
jgi:hypothetical protein